MKDRLDFEETRLPNGIRVFSHRMDVPLFALHIMIPVGSVHSHERNPGGRNGIVHFLEHTVLKRSKRYPELHAFDRFVGAQGGYANAFTGPFWTEFIAEAPAACEQEIVDGLISQIYEPIFKEEDILTERGVVSNERRQKKYYPGKNEISQYLNRDWINDTYYPKEQSLGSDDDLSALSPEVLGQFQSNYSTDEAIVVVSGGHDIEYIKTAFSRLTTKPISLASEYIPIAWGKREYHERRFRDIDHPVYFLGGFESSYDWEVEGVIGFIGGLLINPYNGPLHDWLRNEKGWTYGLHSSSSASRNHIKWTLEIPLNDAGAVPEIRRELMDRARAALSDKVLVQANIERALNRKVFRYQTAESRADTATDMLADLGHVKTEYEIEAFVRSLDDTKRLLDTFDRYTAPESMGEFLALPEEKPAP